MFEATPLKSRIITLFKKHPLLTYYLVTFLLSWGGVVLISGGPGQISSKPGDVPFLPLYFITVAGPMLASLLLTGLYNERKAIVKYFPGCSNGVCLPNGMHWLF